MKSNIKEVKSKPTITNNVSIKKAASFGAKLTCLLDRFAAFQKQEKELIEAKKAETAENNEGLTEKEVNAIALEEAGFDNLKRLINWATVEEYDFFVSIIAELFDVPKEEAEDIPLSDVFDFVLHDKTLRVFMPRLVTLESHALSNI